MLVASRNSKRLRQDTGQQHTKMTESFKDLTSRTSLLENIYIFRFTFGLSLSIHS